MAGTGEKIQRRERMQDSEDAWFGIGRGGSHELQLVGEVCDGLAGS